MKGTHHLQPLLARLARRYVADRLGLDLASFKGTDDAAWIAFAKRLRSRARDGLSHKARPGGNLVTSK
jgi:hypothetical protein